MLQRFAVTDRNSIGGEGNILLLKPLRTISQPSKSSYKLSRVSSILSIS